MQTDPTKISVQGFSKRALNRSFKFACNARPQSLPASPLAGGTQARGFREHQVSFHKHSSMSPGEQEATENKEGGTHRVGPDLSEPGTTFGHQHPYQAAYQLSSLAHLSQALYANRMLTGLSLSPLGGWVRPWLDGPRRPTSVVP